jgi:hypothetical protein
VCKKVLGNAQEWSWSYVHGVHAILHGRSLGIRKLTGKHECYIRVTATVMGEKKQGYDIDKAEGAILWVNFPL